MDNLIEKFYELYFGDSSFLIAITDKQNIKEEWNAYDILYKNLSDEQKKNLLKYVSLRGKRQAEELKEVFIRGFKTAVKLWTESLKE